MSDGALDQSEIERLLSGIGAGAAPVAPSPPAEPEAAPASDSGMISQDELNALFGNATPPPLPTPPLVIPKAPPPPPPPTAPAFVGRWGSASAAAPAFDAVTREDEEGIPRGDLDYLARKTEDSLKSIASASMELPAEVIEFQFPEFGGTVPSSEHATLDQISEVDLDVKVELGRTYMYIEDVLKLRRGSVVPLDKMAGETVDIYINGRLIARGEVLVMNENFCVRVAELLAGAIPQE